MNLPGGSTRARTRPTAPPLMWETRPPRQSSRVVVAMGSARTATGSLMRIAPLALTTASDDEVRDASAVTHAHAISKEACVAFVHILREVLRGDALATAIEGHIPDDPRFDFMRDIESWSRDDVRSTATSSTRSVPRFGAPSTRTTTPAAYLPR